MDLHIDRLIRRLLLAGVPLFPGCLVQSSCPDNPSSLDAYVEVPNPELAGAGGTGGTSMVSAEAYHRCADALDCGALCAEVLPFTHVVSCQRGATDGFA